MTFRSSRSSGPQPEGSAPLQYERLPNGDLKFSDDSGVYLISVYEHDVIRVRWHPRGLTHPHMRRTWALVDAAGDCPREGHDRDDLDALGRFSRPVFEWDETPDGWQVRTEILSIHVDRNAFRLTWADAYGELAADNPWLGYFRDGRAVIHTLNRLVNAEHFYGLGESSGALDKHGRHLRLRNTDAFGYDAEKSHPLYKHVPFYLTLRAEHDKPARAFGLFYDTPYDCAFDFGAEIDNYYGDMRSFRAAGGDLDYYLLYGGTVESVVEKYTALTGRIPMPPRWTLGYLGSAMRYTDAPNAQEMLAEFIALCARHDIRCTGFHLSSGYTMSDEGKRYVFNWNRSRVPQPEAMTGAFHAAGMQVVANVKPGVLTTHPRYAEIAPLLIRAENANDPDLALFWGGDGGHLDFTDPNTFEWWQANITEHLLKYGIDCIWNDNNEFNIRHEGARCAGFGQETPLAALKPVLTMLMVMASYGAQAAYHPARRVWTLTRAGGAGTQRYAATWTGDNRANWNTLRYNIPMGLGLGLSGYANFGHDVGGFAGDPPDPELFLRWVQHGIFQPRFCIHSWRTDEGENAPWMYPEILPQVRELIRFRARLEPYLYALLWEAHRTGHPVIRPTVYHFAADPHTRGQSFEYLAGRGLLVANVLEAGARTRTVYLPAGTGWYDWHSGAYYPGGQTVTVDAPLERIPLFAAEGTILPTEQAGRYTIYAFPHRSAGVGEFTLYEDDGFSKDGPYQEHRLRIEAAGQIHLSAGDVPSDRVEWVLPVGETRPIRV